MSPDKQKSVLLILIINMLAFCRRGNTLLNIQYHPNPDLSEKDKADIIQKALANIGFVGAAILAVACGGSALAIALKEGVSQGVSRALLTLFQNNGNNPDNKPELYQGFSYKLGN